MLVGVVDDGVQAVGREAEARKAGVSGDLRKRKIRL